MTEIKELSDEHRDRQWTDSQGLHWKWVGDSWRYYSPMSSGWVPSRDTTITTRGPFKPRNI